MSCFLSPVWGTKKINIPYDKKKIILVTVSPLYWKQYNNDKR